MNYHCITVQTTQERNEVVSEALEALDALAVTWQDAGDEPLLEPAPGTTPLWQQVVVAAYFADQCDLLKITAQLTLELSLEEINSMRFKQLEETDWQSQWQQSLKPIAFLSSTGGINLWIKPTSKTKEPATPKAVHLYLDPGLAFGSGSHPTTAMCLQYCVEQPPAGLQVIDYGCGSGILALAALRLGASEVWALDHDPQALVATYNNAAQNGLLKESLQMLHSKEVLTVQADLLLANILAKPLISLALYFSKLLKPGASCVLSGLLHSQKEAVWDAYQPYFHTPHWTQREEWVMLTAVRQDSKQIKI